jgi:hypothetical protein
VPGLARRATPSAQARLGPGSLRVVLGQTRAGFRAARQVWPIWTCIDGTMKVDRIMTEKPWIANYT